MFSHAMRVSSVLTFSLSSRAARRVTRFPEHADKIGSPTGMLLRRRCERTRRKGRVRMLRALRCLEKCNYKIRYFNIDITL